MKEERKLLFLDIEWKPAKAYIWRLWNEDVTPARLIDEGGMLCFCAHWGGTKEYLFYSEWEHGRDGMAQAALDMLLEADAVVTYNGDRYDIPKITGEIALAGLQPPPPVNSIDLIKTVKKFGFIMNRLAYIGPLFEAGKKVKHEGFELWRAIIEDDDEKAQAKMRKYCVQDVKMTVKLYERILPFIKNHPFLGKTKKECGNCGEKHNVHKRGYRRTKHYITERLQCQKCGGWSTGTRRKIK